MLCCQNRSSCLSSKNMAFYWENKWSKSNFAIDFVSQLHPGTLDSVLYHIPTSLTSWCLVMTFTTSETTSPITTLKIDCFQGWLLWQSPGSSTNLKGKENTHWVIYPVYSWFKGAQNDRMFSQAILYKILEVEGESICDDEKFMFRR